MPQTHRSFQHQSMRAFVALVAATACATPPARAVTTVDACQSLGRAAPAATSHIGDAVPLPDDIDPRNAVAIATSTIVTLDQAEGRVIAVDSAGYVRWSYGRSGDGPGEVARPNSTRIIGGMGVHWVAAGEGRVVVFDGRSFFIFTETGELVKSWSAAGLAGEGARWARRVRLNGERAYIDVQGLNTRPRAAADSSAVRRFEVFESDSAATRLVAALALPALPRSEGGGTADGLAEAKPRWDLQQNCLVLTDGHSSRLVFVDIRGGERDTVDIGLPEWYVDVAMANEETRGLTQGGMPEPTARARVADVTLAADGMLWLRPSAQSARISAGQVVWRYDVSTGVLRQDTVAVFPRYADRAGGVYGVISDSSGSTVLTRVRSPKRR